MKMNDAKDSILLLCNLLNKLTEAPLASVILRDCAANKASKKSIELLWSALHSITTRVCYCELYGLVNCVKFSFLELGYKGLLFYGLPPSLAGGSRELLIALAWALSAKLIERKINGLILDSYLVKDCAAPEFSKRSVVEVEGSEGLSAVERLAEMTLRAGRLNKEYQLCRGLTEDKERVYQAVARLSVPGLEQLSSLEGVALCLPLVLGEVRSATAPLVHLMDAYLLWANKRRHFFKWVSAVVAAKAAEPSTHLVTEAQLSQLAKFKAVILDIYKKSRLEGEGGQAEAEAEEELTKYTNGRPLYLQVNAGRLRQLERQCRLAKADAQHLLNAIKQKLHHRHISVFLTNSSSSPH